MELAINSTHRSFCVNISFPEDDLFNERISFWVVLQSNDFGVSLRHGRDRVAVNIIDNDGKRNTLPWLQITCTLEKNYVYYSSIAVLGLEFENYTVNEDSTVRVCVRVMNGTLRRTITLQLSTASPLNSETPGIIASVMLSCKYYNILFLFQLPLMWTITAYLVVLRPEGCT